MREWIHRHKETIVILLAIGSALLSGITVGALLILVASILRVL